MIYQNKDLPKGSTSKPYIFTNFVSTVDGKVQVLGKDWKSYWPVGSKKDHEVLTELRALSDALIHGSTTAKSFPFVKTIQTPNLERIRLDRGVEGALPYVVLSNQPDEELIDKLKNPAGLKAYLITNQKANIPEEVEKHVNLIRLKKDKIDLSELITYLANNLSAKRILVEGGPSLLGSFLEGGLIDEIFLTITPKIFGNEPGKTLSLIEGKLFPSSEIVKLKLASSKPIGDEIFLRYKVLR